MMPGKRSLRSNSVSEDKYQSIFAIITIHIVRSQKKAHSSNELITQLTKESKVVLIREIFKRRKSKKKR